MQSVQLALQTHPPYRHLPTHSYRSPPIRATSRHPIRPCASYSSPADDHRCPSTTMNPPPNRPPTLPQLHRSCRCSHRCAIPVRQTPAVHVGGVRCVPSSATVNADIAIIEFQPKLGFIRTHIRRSCGLRRNLLSFHRIVQAIA